MMDTKKIIIKKSTTVETFIHYRILSIFRTCFVSTSSWVFIIEKTRNERGNLFARQLGVVSSTYRQTINFDLRLKFPPTGKVFGWHVQQQTENGNLIRSLMANRTQQRRTLLVNFSIVSSLSAVLFHVSCLPLCRQQRRVGRGVSGRHVQVTQITAQLGSRRT